MGRISRDPENALPNVFFLTGQIIFDIWSFYGIFSIP
jgi:hypothetical protein